ncbi:uncharacterized protein LOC133840016 [Drosophila sulfurigaster albostrigata]|uniref:uncharacterized protein LOC133840016 n=1 Tax=Drosophila sulfurigaster albostrigata TaxID=89887 RepID=UPI002D21E16D|nr:uncharacterized protein LOC133840016 [Drosophila sulfurigaster albostrigata]
MNPKSALHWPLIVALAACLQLGVNSVPIEEKPETRSLFFLLGSSKVNVNVGNNGSSELALRQALEDYPPIQDPIFLADALQNAAQLQEALIRQQFLQSFVQSLLANNAPNTMATILPDGPIDLDGQTDETDELDSEAIDENDGEYDYIDFNKGSRIKYDLDNNRQPVDYFRNPNKILRVRPAPQIVGVFNTQQTGYLIPS